MERVFRERLRDAHRRHPGLVPLAWLGEAWDLVRTGARLRTTARSNGGNGMDGQGWRDDARSALRSLRRSPGFSAFAAGTLALGVGATITFAAFLDRVILRPVDFPHSDRIVMVWRSQGSGLMLSPDTETRDRVRASDAFDAVAALRWGDVAHSTDEGPQMLVGGFIDEDLPRLARVAPLLGRFFHPADLAGGGAPVVVLSEGYWKRALAGDRDVLGRTMTLEGDLYTVVGVAPVDLSAPDPAHRTVDVWLPLAAEDDDGGSEIYGRVREGLTIEQAQERVRALDLAAEDDDGSFRWKTRLMPVEEFATARLRSPLKAVGAAVGLLLLIACINVANLLLARGDLRRRETAVRAALGAGRGRLGRELLLESTLLALVSSAMGLVLAAATLEAVRRLRPEDLAILDGLHLDPVVTVVAVAAAVGTSLAFGFIPLLSRVRTRPGAVLTERTGTAAGDSVALRRVLLVGEIALSFALLAGAIQITAELNRARRRDPGLAADEILAVLLRLPDWRFADETVREDVLERLSARLRGLPDVRAVTLASGAPPNAGIFFGAASAEGQPPTEDAGKAVPMFGNSVEPGYFSAIGQAIVEGRPFVEDDVGAEPEPVILGESSAEKYFPNGGAVGGHFRMGESGPWMSVIGVARDIWASGSATDPGYGQLYVLRNRGSGRVALIRTADPTAVAGRIREAVRSVDAEVPVLKVTTVANGYRDALARERMIGVLLAAFALTAALLAAVGLYGVAAQLAVRRVREFGIRISLGAERRSIFALALRGGVVTLLLGLAAGGGLAWAGLRFLKAGIVGLDGAHPIGFLAATLLLGASALLAMGVPAARAARTDPVEAMRAD
jgi:predicted permease